VYSSSTFAFRKVLFMASRKNANPIPTAMPKNPDIRVSKDFFGFVGDLGGCAREITRASASSSPCCSDVSLNRLKKF
jgi:hypothetical protein